MESARLFLFLVAAVVVLAILARRLRQPPAVVLVLGGLALGALPFAPAPDIDPEIVLLVFLPPILFPTAVAYAREDVVPALGAIGSLAIGLVLATAATVAVAAHLVLDLPWGAAIVLGAVLGPTDPISATGVLRSAGAPDRLATILEGESLVNDGTALTIFRVALGAVGASVSAGSALLDFTTIAVGGMALGTALGWLTARGLGRLDDAEIESALVVLAAYGSYELAEAVGVSGILSTVLAGYVVGRRRSEVTSPETRLQSGSFFALLEFLSMSMLFVLVGLAVTDALGQPGGRSAGTLIAATAAVTAAVALTRLAWMFTVPRLVGIVRAVGPSSRDHVSIPPGEQLVLVVGGMRGAISVAVALAIPEQLNGGEFPQHDAVVLVALASVVVTLVAPALALPGLLRRVGAAGPGSSAARLTEARVLLTEAALERARALERDDEAHAGAVSRALQNYEGRLAQHRRDGDGDGRERARHADAYRAVLRELLAVERRALNDLRGRGAVTGETLAELERDLDLESRRLE